MNNYEHEIVCPDNSGICNYLWYDYFHDSKINNISFDHQKGLVTLTLECSRDIADVWKKLKYDNDIFNAYIHEKIDNFTYVLTFKGTKYFHLERLIMVNDFINGRFKDTALLRTLTAESKKPLFHYRIQIDDGYMDIVFSDFIIRKKAGRVKYPIEKIPHQTCISLTADEKKLALVGDDFERFLTMQKLFRTNDPALLRIARENLWLDDYGDACLYSAYLLGKLGDMNDVPKLFEIYLLIEEHIFSITACRCNAILPKRVIMDSIELIYRRNAPFA